MPGRRQVTASTTAPGRVATSTRTPYTTAVVTPCAAPSPAAANAHADAPSRGPHPAMFVGTDMATRASSASGSIRSGDAVAPAVRAATRKVAA